MFLLASLVATATVLSPVATLTDTTLARAPWQPAASIGAGCLRPRSPIDLRAALAPTGWRSDGTSVAARFDSGCSAAPPWPPT